MRLETLPCYFIMLFIVLSLNACAHPGTQPQAPSSFSSAVKSGAINDGKAHIYAFLGTWHQFIMDNDVTSPANFVVNGVNVGGVNKHECMFIELPQGSYTFAWQERASSLPVVSKPIVFNVAANQNLFVAFDMKTGAGMLLGAVGGLVDSPVGFVEDKSIDGFQTVQNMKVVLPDQAAMAKLYPIAQQ